jgi:hypothetical protein
LQIGQRKVSEIKIDEIKKIVSSLFSDKWLKIWILGI